MISFLTFCESLDTPYPFHWTKRVDGYWIATFTLPTGDVYLCEFIGWNGKWGVAFKRKGDLRHDPFAVVGDTKQEFRIFATVVASVKEFVWRVQPDEMLFTAKEPSRTRLYRRLVSGVSAAIPGYRGLELPGQTYGAKEFLIVKKTKT